MNITIRPATREDARIIEQLGLEFDTYLRSLGDSNPDFFNADTYLRDGFGPGAAFSGIVAEIDSKVVGYLLYHHGYDLDHGGRILYLVDLYVRESSRAKGVGTALMKAAAEICRKAGGGKLVWGVFNPNERAFSFYKSLGAQRLDNMTYMHWKV